MDKITDIVENHWNETNLTWTIFINGGPDLSIFKNEEDDFYQINIWHVGDDVYKNESKWCKIFKNILYKKYDSYDDTLESIKNTLKLRENKLKRILK